MQYNYAHTCREYVQNKMMEVVRQQPKQFMFLRSCLLIRNSCTSISRPCLVQVELIDVGCGTCHLRVSGKLMLMWHFLNVQQTSNGMVIRDDSGEYVVGRTLLFQDFVDLDVGEAMIVYEALSWCKNLVWRIW